MSKIHITTNKEYIPYGEEWAKEMKKLSKDMLIDMLRTAYLKENENKPFNNIIKIAENMLNDKKARVFINDRELFKEQGQPLLKPKRRAKR